MSDENLNCVVRMRPSLGTAVFVNRAIRLLQRWWRWKLLFWRIACLKKVREAVALNGDTAVLFCFASNMKKRFEEDKVGKPLFREAHFHFDFDAEGQVFVHQMGEGDDGLQIQQRRLNPDHEAHEKSSQDEQREVRALQRPFLPQWVGLFANSNKTAVESPRAHSPGENCAATSLLQTKIEACSCSWCHSLCGALSLLAYT